MKLEDELQEEEVVVKCSVKNLFLKISQNLQENTFVGVSFLIKLQVSALKKCVSINYGYMLTSLISL